MNDTDQTKPVTNEAIEPVVTSPEKRPVGAFVGLNEARRLTGKSKETILRYAKDGKLSTQLNGQGNKVYQVVDLERVFGIVTALTSTKSGQANQIEPGEKQAATPLKVARLEGEIAKLEAMLNAEREKSRMLGEMAQKAEQNADDWKQQAKSVERMLTHQPEPLPEARPEPTPATVPEPAPAAEPRRGFMARLFGGNSR